MILWRQEKHLIAGTTLRNPLKKENNTMALHCGGNTFDIIENREHLSKKLDVPMKQWVFAHQTHSDHIQKVDLRDGGKGIYEQNTAIQDCDALYTREPNVLIGVFHADCVAVLLEDPVQGIICAIHSGWMGTIKEITTKAMQTLIKKEGCLAKDIHAYIAPAIAFSSFEVGNEVVEKVQQLPFDTTPYIKTISETKALVDNKGLNREMLLQAGVLPHHITMDKNDTFLDNPSFFSYRRDKSCGRHLSFIVRKA